MIGLFESLARQALGYRPEIVPLESRSVAPHAMLAGLEFLPAAGDSSWAELHPAFRPGPGISSLDAHRAATSKPDLAETPGLDIIAPTMPASARAGEATADEIGLPSPSEISPANAPKISPGTRPTKPVTGTRVRRISAPPKPAPAELTRSTTPVPATSVRRTAIVPGRRSPLPSVSVAPQPPVRVSIATIASEAPQPKPKRAGRPAPQLSLDRYLDRRAGGR